MRKHNSAPDKYLDPVTRVERYVDFNRRRIRQTQRCSRKQVMAVNPDAFGNVYTEGINAWKDSNFKTIYDPQYGQLVFPDWVWEVIHTPEMQRMHLRAQSSVPARWSKTGTVCSTLEHTIGATYLADLVESRTGTVLKPAVLSHDFSAGAFRHFTDRIMEKILGFGHEGRVRLKLRQSETGACLARHGFDLDAIADICTGKGIEGELVASCHGGVDVDSADNVKRFNDSKGLTRRPTTAGGDRRLHGPLMKSLAYSPEALVKGYCLLPDGRLAVRASAAAQYQGYYEQRQLLYDHVGIEVHLAAEVMIMRALWLAYEAGQITPDFFDLDDEEARLYLYTCVEPCRNIIEALDRGKLYRAAYLEWNHELNLEGVVPHWGEYSKAFDVPETLCSKKLDDMAIWNQFADDVADLLELPREEVAVQVRLGDKGYRQPKLPVLHADGRVEEYRLEPSYSLFNPCSARWKVRISVFASRAVMQPYEVNQYSSWDDADEHLQISQRVITYFANPERFGVEFRRI